MDIVVNLFKTECPNKKSALRDMLTDVRHVADVLEIDFDDVLEGSLSVYHTEKEEN